MPQFSGKLVFLVKEVKLIRVSSIELGDIVLAHTSDNLVRARIFSKKTTQSTRFVLVTRVRVNSSQSYPLSSVKA